MSLTQKDQQNFHPVFVRSFDINPGITATGNRIRVDLSPSVQDINADSKPDLVLLEDNKITTYLSAMQEQSSIITGYTSSNGVRTDIVYKDIMKNGDEDDLLYPFSGQVSDLSNTSPTNYPYSTPLTGMQVVAEVRSDAADNSRLRVEYNYGGPLIHTRGRGFAGFELIQSYDHQSEILSRTQYYQRFPLIGLPAVTTKKDMRSNHLLSVQKNYYAGVTFPSNAAQTMETTTLPPFNNDLSRIPKSSQGGYNPYLANALEETWTLSSEASNGSERRHEMGVTYTRIRQDNWGNVTELDSTMTLGSNEYITETRHSYQEAGYAQAREKGRLSRTVVTKRRTEQGRSSPARSLQTDFRYYANGLLRETIESAPLTPTLITDKSYDTYGNVTSTSVHDVPLDDSAVVFPRVSRTDWAGEGRFVNYQENSFGHRVSFTYNGLNAENASGMTLELGKTGPNNLTSYQFFTHEGREHAQVDVQGVRTESTLAFWNTNGTRMCSSVVGITQESCEYHDAFGNKVEETKRDFNGDVFSQYAEYDHLNRVVAFIRTWP